MSGRKMLSWVIAVLGVVILWGSNGTLAWGQQPSIGQAARLGIVAMERPADRPPPRSPHEPPPSPPGKPNK